MVCCGMGINSISMTMELIKKKVKLDIILFANTGGEKPHTYNFIPYFNQWLKKNRTNEVTVIQASQPQQISDGCLENECLRLWNMPSKAYGFGTCSLKWKIMPQQVWVERYLLKHKIDNPSIIKYIGYDADEANRASRSAPYEGIYSKEYPLIDWGWGREECIKKIRQNGLPSPGKSSCFFCPSTKKKEILKMIQQYPNLVVRSLEIERRGMSLKKGPSPQTTVGLGRSFMWRDFILDAAKKDFKVSCDEENDMMPCDNCYDGEV